MSDPISESSTGSQAAKSLRPNPWATVAAVLTAPGRSALATVRVVGPDAIGVVASLCCVKPNALREKCRKGRLWLGHWRGSQGEPIVVHVPRPDIVEIHCHGGRMPVETVLDDLAGVGVPEISWSDLARKGSSTFIEAEALEALAQAPTLRTAAILLDQLHGALSNCVTALLAHAGQGQDAEVMNGLNQLLARSELGLHLVAPWRIAIVGRPNVGKSSLLNAILGFERAIVHETAGTTRDLVTASTAVDGWPVEFTDSAGIRSADDAIEMAGVERARLAITRSDCQLVVFDHSQPVTCEDDEILKTCPHPIVVVNKVDLPAAPEQACLSVPSFPVSATTQAGLSDLIRHLGAVLVANPSGHFEAVPFTHRQVGALQKAKRLVSRGELQEAGSVLGELLGGGGVQRN